MQEFKVSVEQILKMFKPKALLREAEVRQGKLILKYDEPK